MNPLKGISNREILIIFFIWGGRIELGNHGPLGPATDRSESVRDF